MIHLHISQIGILDQPQLFDAVQMESVVKQNVPYEDLKGIECVFRMAGNLAPQLGLTRFDQRDLPLSPFCKSSHEIIERLFPGAAALAFPIGNIGHDFRLLLLYEELQPLEDHRLNKAFGTAASREVPTPTTESPARPPLEIGGCPEWRSAFINDVEFPCFT